MALRSSHWIDWPGWPLMRCHYGPHRRRPPSGVAAVQGAEGALNLYLRQPLNSNQESTSGLDFQVDYTRDLFAGTLDWHFVGNYTDSQTRTSIGITVNGAGAVSGDSSVNPLAGFTMPKFRATSP